MLQLNPPIPLKTPKGEGLAVLVIDYGPDHDLWWTVILTKGACAGEIWTYANPQVRGVENITLGRHPTPPPVDAEEQTIESIRRGAKNLSPMGPGARLPGEAR